MQCNMRRYKAHRCSYMLQFLTLLHCQKLGRGGGGGGGGGGGEAGVFGPPVDRTLEWVHCIHTAGTVVIEPLWECALTVIDS